MESPGIQNISQWYLSLEDFFLLSRIFVIRFPTDSVDCRCFLILLTSSSCSIEITSCSKIRAGPQYFSGNNNSNSVWDYTGDTTPRCPPTHEKMFNVLIWLANTILPFGKSLDSSEFFKGHEVIKRFKVASRKIQYKRSSSNISWHDWKYFKTEKYF